MNDRDLPRSTRNLPEVPITSPRTVAEARVEVQRSRARIEATLDQLEDRVVATKETIQRKVDMVKPAREFVRTKPLLAVGGAIAVGLFLGALGGSDDDDDEDEYGFDKRERKALEEWKERRRKLLWNEAEDAAEMFEEPPGRLSRFFRAVGHEAAGVMLGIIGAEVAGRLGGGDDDGDEDEDLT